MVMLQAQIGNLSPEPFVRSNITTTEKVLESIKEYAVPYIVDVSSSVVESSVMDCYVSTKLDQNLGPVRQESAVHGIPADCPDRPR